MRNLGQHKPGYNDGGTENSNDSQRFENDGNQDFRHLWQLD